VSVSDDEWAWARQEAEDAPPVIGFEHVTAILVTYNGQDWLPSTLRALARLEQRPGRMIAIDASSTDDSGRLLRQAFVDGVAVHGALVRGVIDEVLTAPSVGFSSVVNQTIAAMPDAPGWVWLLHDDSAPAASCLTNMLRVATAPTPDAGPAVVVPKLLRPKLRNRPDQVQSIGEAISPSGARVTGSEVGDIDQQQDESMRALGASTAGLLVRRDAWAALGGLSPELPGFRAGVDLGWRANEAGMTVRTAPDAALRHQQAGLIGLRNSIQASDPEVEDLVAGLRVVAAHSAHPAWAVLRARLMNRLAWFGAWLAKDAGQAHVRSATIKRFRTEQAETRRLAGDVRTTAVKPVRKSLLPGLLWGIRHTIESAAGRVGYRDDEDSDINLDALTVDDEDTVYIPRPQRRNWLGLTLTFAVLVATLVACRGLFSLGALASTGLAPAPTNLLEAWHAWLVPGAAQGANAPWLGIMALGASVFGGQPGIWAGAMILGGVLLSTWSAYRFVRVFIGPVPACAGLGLLWGLVLPVTGASADGSPGWVILGVALPWLASAMVRWSRERISGLVGLRLPATAGLTLALACCVTPGLWFVGVLGAAAVVLRIRDWRGLFIIAFGPLLLLGPWIPRLLEQPGRLLTGVDPCLSRLADAPDPLGILLGRVGLGAVEGSLPWWWSAAVFGALWLLGLIGIACLPESRRRVWLLVGLVAALVASLIVSRLTVMIEDQITRAAVLPWLMVAAIIAIGAAAASWPVLANDAEDDATLSPLRQAQRLVLGIVIGFAVVLGSAWWIWAGQSAPLHRLSQPVPDYVVAAEQSPRATRTLVVAVANGQASVSVHDATSPMWGSGERPAIALDHGDRDAVVALAGQFADGFATDDLATRLSALGIGHVVISGVPQASIDAMSGVPNLAGGTVSGLTVWTVGGLPSRAQLLENGQLSPITDGVVPAGRDGRQLVLLETSELGWWASVDNVLLEAGESPTRFVLPSTGGELKWGLPVTWGGFAWHLVVLCLLFWAALPASSVAERLARAEARRAVS